MDGGFSVKLIMYKALDLSLDTTLLFRSIWNLVIPSKLGFFTWEATWGKVLTLD